jgi:isovaleryl-CoA dehydrogenase
MYFPLTEQQQRLLSLAQDLAHSQLEPRAAEVDHQPCFPRENFAALREAGLMGMTVKPEHGGLGADILSVVLVVEALAQACPSTSMCFKMHLEAIQALTRLATPDQVERLLRPIARGEKLATVAGSEPGSGSQTGTALTSSATKVGPDYAVENVQKSFVTSANEADLFFFLTRHDPSCPPHVGTAFMVERDKIDCSVLYPWDGLGMRGNGSSPMTFSGKISEANRIVGEGGLARDVFPVLFPFVCTSYAAVFLGVAQGAFEVVCQHVKARRFEGSGKTLAEIETIQRYIAEMKLSLDRTRALLHHAAILADQGHLEDMTVFFEAMVAADETALEVTSTAMTVGGGMAFAKRNALERYLRDARAGTVMGPTDDICKLTVARMHLGLPMG